MKIDIDQRTIDANTYRAARVKSLFNCEDGSRFTHTAELDIDDADWKIGVVVGPSGSGKTSIGRRLWGGEAFYDPAGWPEDGPIIDGIDPGGSFDGACAALGTVGLGDVPAWLRPYAVLSNGEKFRADLARIVAEKPARVVIDEFTSVVDRQIAKVGAGAFAKSWRRTNGQAVLLSCHYDILDWLEPDWVYDTTHGHFARGSLQHRRPRLQLEIREGGWELWPYFKPHHYLDSNPMIAARCYVGFIDGEPVVHLGMGTKNITTKKGVGVEARGCRLVVMPEWQGAGVGMKFLNYVCELQRQGKGRLPGRRMTTIFHTSHPQLAAGLRRDKRWRQVSAALHGANRAKSAASMARSFQNRRHTSGVTTGYGGHMRAVQGFRYVGLPEEATP